MNKFRRLAKFSSGSVCAAFGTWATYQVIKNASSQPALFLPAILLGIAFAGTGVAGGLLVKQAITGEEDET